MPNVARDGRGGDGRNGRERPEIIADAAGKWQAFGEADAALCASGTVSLELALAGVPLVACYKLDRAGQRLSFLVTAWSASLPNLIADRVIVPEYYNEHDRARAQLARELEAAVRRHADARAGSSTASPRSGGGWRRERPSGEIAADVVLGRKWQDAVSSA